MSPEPEVVGKNPVEVKVTLDNTRKPICIRECHILPLPPLGASSNNLLVNIIDFLEVTNRTQEGDNNEYRAHVCTIGDISMKFFKEAVQEGKELPLTDNGIIFDLVQAEPHDFAWHHYKYDPYEKWTNYTGEGEIDYDRYDSFLDLFDSFETQYKKDVNFDENIKRVKEITINGIKLPIKNGVKIISGIPVWFVSDWKMKQEYPDINSEEERKPNEAEDYTLFMPEPHLASSTFLDFVKRDMASLWQILDPKAYGLEGDEMDFVIDIEKAKMISGAAFLGDHERTRNSRDDYYDTNYAIATRLASEMGCLWDVARIAAWAQKSVKNKELVDAIKVYYESRVERITDFFAGKHWLSRLATRPALNEDAESSFGTINGKKIEVEMEDSDSEERRLTAARTKIVDFLQLLGTPQATARIIDAFDPKSRESLYQFFDTVGNKDYAGNEEQFEIDLMNLVALPWQQFLREEL
jgi:hypothetical protein